MVGEGVGGELDSRGRRVGVHLLRAGGARDRGSDLGPAKHPGQGELRHREAEPFSRSARAVAPPGAIDSLSTRSFETFILSFANRLSAGSGSPGLYLPVSMPWASGDQTICEMPFAAVSGKTSTSGACHSMEYCGCDETNRSGPAKSIAAWICSGVHSLKPR